MKNYFDLPNSVDSIVVLRRNKKYIESDAVIEIFSQLGIIWKLAALFMNFVPMAIRNLIYRWIARNRFKICRPVKKNN